MKRQFLDAQERGVPVEVHTFNEKIVHGLVTFVDDKRAGILEDCGAVVLVNYKSVKFMQT